MNQQFTQVQSSYHHSQNRRIYIFVIIQLFFYCQIKQEMKKFLRKYLIMVAALCVIQMTSNQCIRYNGTQCLECFKNYYPSGGVCLQNSTQIIQKTPKDVSKSVNFQNIQVNGLILQQIRKVTNSTEMAEAPNTKKQPQNHADITLTATQHYISSSNSLNLVKIRPFDSSQITENTIQDPITLADIKQYSVNSAFIQRVFNSYLQQILENEVNRISLQLFQFTRIKSLDIRFDPYLRDILTNVLIVYNQKLKSFGLLTVYYRYISFAKIYKLFFANTPSIKSIQILQVDSMVDLFHMQIYTSSCSEYNTIMINETTIQSIRNRTRLN